METPILYINRQQVLDSYFELKSAIPQANIAYAIKANPHEQIISLLNNEGAHFETASINEIEQLLNLGIEPEKITFSNPVKPKQAVHSAAALGVTTQSFDSLYELEKFSGLSHIRPVLRLQVPNEGSLWPLSDKFGCPPFHWDNIFKELIRLNLPLAGFTFHVGSQAESLNAWDAAMQLTLQAWKRAIELGLQPSLLNVGGGFPIYLGRETPTVQQIAARIQAGINCFEKEGINIQELWAEPGRYISGSAGYLYARVIGKAKREKGTWIFLDCGVFGGLMETIDGISYPVSSNGSGPTEKVTLCGPSCDSVDTMFEVNLPAVEVDDIIRFQGAGAYTTVYASSFNGFKGPETRFVNSIEDLPELSQTTVFNPG